MITNATRGFYMRCFLEGILSFTCYFPGRKIFFPDPTDPIHVTSPYARLKCISGDASLIRMRATKLPMFTCAFMHVPYCGDVCM
jgi:hypothetical protein